jgi:hypothetical protein
MAPAILLATAWAPTVPWNTVMVMARAESPGNATWRYAGNGGGGPRGMAGGDRSTDLHTTADQLTPPSDRIGISKKEKACPIRGRL